MGNCIEGEEVMNRTIATNSLVFLALTMILTHKTEAQANSPGAIDKTQLSVQERVVRYTYRKVYTYGLAGNLDRNKFLKRVPDGVAAKSSIRFELNNFQIGPIEQIRNVRFFDLTTPPNGEIIQLSSTDTFTNDRKRNRVDASFSLTAQWVNGKYASGMDKNITFGEVMRYQPARFSQFETYAVYDVTVFLDGKTRTYRAFALFPNVNRSAKSQKPEFFDNVVGLGGTITNIFKEFKEPKGFVRQKLNKAFRSGTDPKPPAGSDPVKIGKQDAVNGTGRDMSANYFSKASYGEKKRSDDCFLYDVIFGISCKCIGVSSLLFMGPSWDWSTVDMGPDDAMCLVPTLEQTGDLIGGGSGGEYCEPRYTVRPNVSGFKRDRTHHLTGEHYGNVVLSGSCYQDEACNNICRVEEQIPPSVGETGDDTEIFYYHQGALRSLERVDQGGKDAELQCDRSVGYAFSRCLILGCGVTAEITANGPVGAGATFSGGDLWNDGFTLANQCKNGQ
jgi:hypothetical protein